MVTIIWGQGLSEDGRETFDSIEQARSMLEHDTDLSAENWIGSLRPASQRTIAASGLWLNEAGRLTSGLFRFGVILRQSKNMGISHFLMIPILILTFMFGRAGLLVFFGIKSIYRKQLQLTQIQGCEEH